MFVCVCVILCSSGSFKLFLMCDSYQVFKVKNEPFIYVLALEQFN